MLIFYFREELKERPRLVVGPLRVERNDDTPDEPTPGKDRPELMDIDNDIVKPGENNEVTKLIFILRNYFQVVEAPENKTFVSGVSRMIRDLLMKVESLEGMMVRQKKNSPRA